MEPKTKLCNALSVFVPTCPGALLSLSMAPLKVHKQILNLALFHQGLTGLKLSFTPAHVTTLPYTIHPLLIVCCSLGYFWPLFFHMSAYNAMVTKLYFHLFSFHFSISI